MVAPLNRCSSGLAKRSGSWAWNRNASTAIAPSIPTGACQEVSRRHSRNSPPARKATFTLNQPVARALLNCGKASSSVSVRVSRLERTTSSAVAMV